MKGGNNMKKRIGIILGMAFPVVIAAISELANQVEANKQEEKMNDMEKRLSILEQNNKDSE